MSTTTNLTILKLLASGRDPQFVSEALGCSKATVLQLAGQHHAVLADGTVDAAAAKTAARRLENDAAPTIPVRSAPAHAMPIRAVPAAEPARAAPSKTQAPAAVTDTGQPRRCNHAELLFWAHDHTSKRVQAAGQRATEALAWLDEQHTAEVETEQARREAEAARAELEAAVTALEAELAEKKAALRDVAGKPVKSRPAKTPATGAAELTKAQRTEIRAWAQARGYEVGDRGRIPASIVEAWTEAHREGAA
jgi:hypothetical protein